MTTQPIARYIPEVAIDAMLATEYRPAYIANILPRDHNGRCALGVGLYALGFGAYPAPISTVFTDCLVAYYEMRPWLVNPITDRLKVDYAASVFIGDFDKGGLLGDRLAAALGRLPAGRKKLADGDAAAAAAAVESLLARSAVGV